MLLEAGIPLLDALLIIKKQSWNRALADAIDLLVESIEQGETISSGLQKSPGIFDPLAVSLVSSGEVSGTLPEALVRLAQHLERNIKIQREALSAMIYPLSVLTVAALVSSFLLIFIIPVFRELFLDLGAELPWPTRVTVALSEFVIKNVPTLCGALVVFSFFLLTTLRSTRGKRIIMAIFLLLPLSKDNMTLRALARTTRTLGTALQSGIPIITALKISSKTAGNSSIERTLERAIREISEGRSLTHALRTSSSIPSMMIEMLEVGERTGQLDTILLTLADNFEIDAERALNTMKQVMEPLILAALGLVIGGFVISMYLPVFSLGTMAR
jgi:type IV pilus assembly protein PilC